MNLNVVKLNLKQEARELVNNLNERMGPSPYDIAWLARLQNNFELDLPWPDLSEWLLENQHPDGSWGGQIHYYHDRVICTLTALLALKEKPAQASVQQAIQRGEKYLWNNLHWLSRDPFELVGFELLMPTLISQAHGAGLNVPDHAYGYEKLQIQKLMLVPPEMLYSSKSTVAHSLEFLGRSSKTEQLDKAVFKNGSLGNSPAATAYYLWRKRGNLENAKGSVEYLNRVLTHRQDIIYLYPFRTFELAWVLNNLAFSGVSITDFADDTIWDELEDEMEANGVGLDASFGITDGDTTSVALRLLVQAGREMPYSIIKHFEDPETHIFRTYHYERNVSVGTNIHALEALNVLPDYPERYPVQAQVVVALLDQRIYNTYWVDKWHTSPYYATSHVIIAFLEMSDRISVLKSTCQQTLEWLFFTQNKNGSWGFYGIGTAEETAYVLTMLLRYHRKYPNELVNPDILHRAAAYLYEQEETARWQYPELWIGKCLYTPHNVVRSAILAALILYEDTFGRTP